jgi:hypothetical protein
MRRPRVEFKSGGSTLFTLAIVVVFLEGYAKSHTTVWAKLLGVVAGLCVVAAAVWIFISRRTLVRREVDLYENASEFARQFHGSPFLVNRFRSHGSFATCKYLLIAAGALLGGIGFTATAIRDVVNAASSLP